MEYRAMTAPRQQTRQPTPAELVGLKYGSKEAVIYNHLARECQATITEIAKRMEEHPAFDDTGKILWREISGVVHRLCRDGFVEPLMAFCAGREPYYKIAAKKHKPAETPESSTEEPATVEPTNTEQRGDFMGYLWVARRPCGKASAMSLCGKDADDDETMESIRGWEARGDEVIKIARYRNDKSLPWICRSGCNDCLPKSVNPTSTAPVSDQKHWSDDGESLPDGITTETVTVYRVPGDDAKFLSLDEAKEWAAKLRLDKAINEFLANPPFEPGANPAYMLRAWEIYRGKYLGVKA